MLVFLSQAALVLTHVLGLVYSSFILLALILFDAAKGHLRYKLYLVYGPVGWPSWFGSRQSGHPWRRADRTAGS